MLRRVLGIVLVALITVSSTSLFTSVVAQTRSDEDRARIEVAKAGIGSDARVEVQLRDGTKVKGNIQRVDPDSFAIIDGSGTVQPIAFADVKSVSRKSNGFWTRTKLITAAAVGAGAIVTWIIVKPALCDGGAQSRGPC